MYEVYGPVASTFQSLALAVYTTGLNVKKVHVLPTEYLCVSYGSPNKHIEVFLIRHSTISFYDRGDKCLLCGTNGVFYKIDYVSSLNG
jgi:hypothetical protein